MGSNGLMGTTLNPALAAFLASISDEREWAQIVIRRLPTGFELRHVADRSEPSQLRAITLAELRKLSLGNAAGQFRPLKSAPDLPSGWRFVGRDETDLWRALQELYPGSIPDWFAAQGGAAPVTNYRDYTNRQTGMYRLTQQHSDEQAARVITACCAPRFCLKQRLWSVAGLDPDAAQMKSAIPCLEPCALLLELARKSARIEQEESSAAAMPLSDREAFLAAVENSLAHPPAGLRAGDIASPLNPRRLQLLLEKYRNTGKRESNNPTEH